MRRRFTPKVDPNHPSLKPDGERKGSYYRRIEDITHGLRMIEVDTNKNDAVKFIAYYFGCEKLARGIIGIHLRNPAIDAYHHRNLFLLADLEVSNGAMGLSISTSDLLYLFADFRDLPRLHAVDPSSSSARLLRNKVGHDLGPTNVQKILNHSQSLIPKMQAFLAIDQKVLGFLRANFAQLP